MDNWRWRRVGDIVGRIRLMFAIWRRPAARRALRDAEVATTSRRRIYFRHRPVPDRYHFENGVTTLRDCYILTLDRKSLTFQHTAVHECLHIILNEEAYPWPLLPLSLPIEGRRDLVGMLCSSWHHPEIYRRMQALYGLDMTDYWKRHDEAACRRWNHAAPSDATLRQITANVCGSVPMFLRPDTAPQAIALCRILAPESFRVGTECARAVAGCDTGDPAGCRTFATAFLSYFQDYFEEVGIDSEWLHAWRAIRVGNLEDAVDHDPELFEIAVAPDGDEHP